MHLGIASLLAFYQRHCQDDALVLATITATSGSTYRKPGAMMLISRDGQFAGLISGGCLEADLLQHAAGVFAAGRPQMVTYDMHAGDELVWGLGLGCDGVIALLLQRLDRERDYALLDQLSAAQNQRQPVLLALVVESSGGHLAIGQAALLDRAGAGWGADELVGLCQDQVEAGWPQWRQRQTRQDDYAAMLVNIRPQPRVLLCGAGPDTVPVAQAVVALGWACVVVDHRPAFASAQRFHPNCSVLQCRPEQLAVTVHPESIDAAVVMSHHLENDAVYLRLLDRDFARSGLAYIGVLGPAARRARLQQMAAVVNIPLHGPVGLDIGAELPEAIALAIVAEIHAVLNGRNGQSLTSKAATAAAENSACSGA